MSRTGFMPDIGIFQLFEHNVTCNDTEFTVKISKKPENNKYDCSKSFKYSEATGEYSCNTFINLIHLFYYYVIE